MIIAGRPPRATRWSARSAVLKAFDAPPRPRFGHGAEHRLPAGPLLLGCYHPSRQNTATGVLTAPMLDDVLGRARELADA